MQLLQFRTFIIRDDEKTLPIATDGLSVVPDQYHWPRNNVKKSNGADRKIFLGLKTEERQAC